MQEAAPQYLWSRVLDESDTYQLEISEPIRVCDSAGKYKLFVQTYRIRVHFVQDDRCELVSTETVLRDPGDPMDEGETLEVEPMVYRAIVREFMEQHA